MDCVPKVNGKYKVC